MKLSSFKLHQVFRCEKTCVDPETTGCRSSERHFARVRSLTGKFEMVTPEGIEPSTSDLEGPCSIQLSYGATRAFSGRGPCHARARVMKIDIGSST